MASQVQHPSGQPNCKAEREVGPVSKKALDVRGRQFGDLRVVRSVRTDTKTHSNVLMWECACKCGGISIVAASALVSGRTKSCGCAKTTQDIAGRVFNKLTAVKWVGNTRYGSEWECVCTCGNKRVVRAANLRNGSVKSCGCTGREASAKRSRTHGMSNKPEWRAWESMRKRCFNSNHKHYHRYGGRGITVCERWMRFEEFFADMGPKPSEKHSLERLDNDGNYEPANCKWATMIEQQNNKSSNVVVEFNGVGMTVTEWSRHLNIKENTLRARLAKGWPMARAVEPPVGRASPGTSARYNPMRGKRALKAAGHSND